MGKHDGGHEGKHQAKTDSTHIGKHRQRDDVQHDPRGFSVGRGVTDQPEHNRS